MSLTRHMGRSLARPLASALARALTGATSGFDPMALFAGGVQGFRFDPNDMSTLFQDTAAATPVTAVNQPVRRINDKSGNGYHATGPAGVTLSARTNLLLKSELFTNAYWSKSNLTLTANAAANPVNGSVTATKVVATSAVGGHYIYDTIGVDRQSAANSIYVKAAELTKVAVRESASTGNYAAFDLTAGTVLFTSGGVSSATITALAGGWFRISVVFPGLQSIGIGLVPNSYTSGDPFLGWTGNNVDGLYIFGAQVELGAVGKYQSIDTAASYDTVGFPKYLISDGIGYLANFTFPYNASCFLMLAAKSEAAAGSTNRVIGFTANKSIYDTGTSWDYVQPDTVITATPPRAIVKVIGFYKANDTSAVAINGLVDSATVTTTPQVTTGLGLFCDDVYGSDVLASRIYGVVGLNATPTKKQRDDEARNLANKSGAIL